MSSQYARNKSYVRTEQKSRQKNTKNSFILGGGGTNLNFTLADDQFVPLRVATRGYDENGGFSMNQEQQNDLFQNQVLQKGNMLSYPLIDALAISHDNIINNDSKDTILNSNTKEVMKVRNGHGERVGQDHSSRYMEN